MRKHWQGAGLSHVCIRLRHPLGSCAQDKGALPQASNWGVLDSQTPDVLAGHISDTPAPYCPEIL